MNELIIWMNTSYICFNSLTGGFFYSLIKKVKKKKESQFQKRITFVLGSILKEEEIDYSLYEKGMKVNSKLIISWKGMMIRLIPPIIFRYSQQVAKQEEHAYLCIWLSLSIWMANYNISKSNCLYIYLTICLYN